MRFLEFFYKFCSTICALNAIALASEPAIFTIVRASINSITGKRDVKKKCVFLSTMMGILILGGLSAEPRVSNIEIPRYELIQSFGNIEIRRYQPMIIAYVEVGGGRSNASGSGFSLLADYIFGNNTVKKKIAMTAPVQQQSNMKIAMTAPVQQQSKGRSWEISFVMPSEYTMEMLPEPNNSRVKLKEEPSRKFAVIQFSGRITENNIREHENQLADFIEVNQITVIGFPKYAFYNPPWTLPVLRHNEVMIEIE